MFRLFSGHGGGVLLRSFSGATDQKMDALLCEGSMEEPVINEKTHESVVQYIAIGKRRSAAG